MSLYKEVHCAFYEGDIDKMKELIEEGLKLKHTHLEMACQFGHEKMIKLMESYGLCNWIHGARGACKGAKLEILKDMIKKGISRDSYTELFELSLEYRSYDITDFFIEENVEIDSDCFLSLIKGDNEKYLKIFEHEEMDFSDGKFMADACQMGNMKIINFLLEKGNKAFIRGLEGALRSGNVECVKLMVSLGADIGYVPIGAIAGNYKNRKEIMEYFLENIGKLVTDHYYVYNALFVTACKKGNIEGLKVLMGKGMHPTSPENCHINACEGGNLEIVKLVEKYGVSSYDESIRRAFMSGRIDVVKYILEEKMNVLPVSTYIFCLEYAAIFSNVDNELLKYLLDNELKIAESSKIETYDIVILHVSKTCNIELFATLLQKEMKLNGSFKKCKHLSITQKYDYKSNKSMYVKLLMYGITTETMKKFPLFSDVDNFESDIKERHRIMDKIIGNNLLDDLKNIVKSYTIN